MKLRLLARDPIYTISDSLVGCRIEEAVLFARRRHLSMLSNVRAARKVWKKSVHVHFPEGLTSPKYSWWDPKIARIRRYLVHVLAFLSLPFRKNTLWYLRFNYILLPKFYQKQTHACVKKATWSQVKICHPIIHISLPSSASSSTRAFFHVAPKVLHRAITEQTRGRGTNKNNERSTDPPQHNF